MNESIINVLSIMCVSFVSGFMVCDYITFSLFGKSILTIPKEVPTPSHGDILNYQYSPLHSEKKAGPLPPRSTGEGGYQVQGRQYTLIQAGMRALGVVVIACAVMVAVLVMSWHALLWLIGVG